MPIAIVTIVLSMLALSLVHPEKLPPPTNPLGAELAPLPAEVHRALTFGCRTTASDLEWLNAIQYYGNPANAEEKFSRLASIVDLVTDFDPHFEYAYQFAGDAVPYHAPDGEKLWYNTKQAIALLRKGMTNQPHRWEIPWLLGYNLYTFWGEYQAAGEAMNRAAELADIGRREDERFSPPTYLRSLALRLLAQGGAIETAIETTRLAVAQALDEQSREELLARLAALTLEQELQQLNGLADAARNSGHAPSAVRELLSGANEDLAQDPYGDPYFIDAAGRVKSRNEDKLLRLKIHPGQPAIERAFN
jgi:tetratricopeptide (TPR) repeat protein